MKEQKNPSIRRDEIRVLERLRKNSRLVVSNAAKEAEIRPARFHRIMETLCKRGIIKKYASLIDFQKANFPIRALFVFAPEKGSEKRARDFILNHPSINTASSLTQNRLFADGVFSCMKDFYDFRGSANEHCLKEEMCTHVFEDLKAEGLVLEKQ